MADGFQEEPPLLETQLSDPAKNAGQAQRALTTDQYPRTLVLNSPRVRGLVHSLGSNSTGLPSQVVHRPVT
jgi:hypothetical protein